MGRVAKVLDRLPVFAIAATALFATTLGNDVPTTPQGATFLFLGLALAIAPLAEKTPLSTAPAAVDGAVVLLVLFGLLAVPELGVMRLLRDRPARTRWIVRTSALLVFVLIVLMTPPPSP